jgi:anti-sigma factor RsiW
LVLQQFLLGLLAPDAIEAVGRHLETCPACCAALEAVPAEDELTRCVKEGLEGGEPSEAQVARLIRKVQSDKGS